MGQQGDRYQAQELPSLDFADGTFALALCSHFLFLYSTHYDLTFHQDSIREMLRVSREVRIFPLLTLMLDRSPYLDAIINTFQREGYRVEIVQVPYELQKGGNEMLSIRHPKQH